MNKLEAKPIAELGAMPIGDGAKPIGELGAEQLVELFRGPGLRSSAQREIFRLVHELQVHQAELELQSQELERTREDLERTKEHYFELYELAPVGYATLDSIGRIVEANLTLSNLLHIERQRLLGTSFAERMPFRERARFEASRADLMDANAEPMTLEVSLRQEDGRFVGAMLQAMPGATADGTLRIAVIDLTKLRHSEALLREREAHLSAVLDTVVDGIVTVDARGRIESCNSAACRLFGGSSSWLVGQPVSRILPGFLTLAGRGRAELVAQRVDGGRFPVEVGVGELNLGLGELKVVLGAERGSVTKFVGVISDISERKRRATELEETLARFRLIADHIDDAIYVVEADTGKTLYASPALETIFGRSTSEVHAEPWPRFAWIAEEDRERVEIAAQRLREGKSPFDVQYRVVRPDGALRSVRSRAFLVPEHNRLTGIIHDMTDELSLQAELRQAQRLEAIGTLASGVAHDFNNLLMGVGGCVQLAMRRLEPEHDAHAYIRRARDAILRGASLTRQILRFSDTRSTTDEPVVLDSVVSGARALIHSLIGEHIALSLITGAPGLLIAADAGDLEQVLLNLASNARDAMPDGGRLTFRSEPYQGGMVALSVHDTGVGMDEETKRRVFEPFFTTKEVGKGTGLGLSTVFAVVRRMGGSVDIDSKPGQGTTFTLYLPVVISDPSVRPSEQEEGAPGQGQIILVVDDDPLVRMTVETHVESLGYRAITASSVTDALKVYTESPRPIDVVLTDIMMPGLLGSDLNRILQKSAPDVSVIFMSAHPWQELVRQGHLKENARLLAKPFDARDLGLALHQALKDKPLRAQSTRLRIFVVDDNEDLVDALRDLLEMEGHAVSTAISSAEALRKIPEFVPDVVLCDLNVDDVSGLEIVSRLHRNELLSHTVFLAVTGVAPQQSRSAALAAGFQDVLVKPLDFHELSRLLVSHVRR